MGEVREEELRIKILEFNVFLSSTSSHESNHITYSHVWRWFNIYNEVHKDFYICVFITMTLLLSYHIQHWSYGKFLEDAVTKYKASILDLQLLLFLVR